MMDDLQIARLLVAEHLIDVQGLEEAQRQQNRHGGDLYTVLIENSFVDEEKTITLVSQHMNIPCVSLKDFEANEGVLELLPAEMASRYRAVPLGVSHEHNPPSLFLAMANPVDVDAMEDIGHHTGLDIVAFLAGPLDIDKTLERCYGSRIYGNQSHAASLRANPFAGPSVSNLMDLPLLDDPEIIPDASAPQIFSNVDLPMGVQPEQVDVSLEDLLSDESIIPVPKPVLSAQDLARLSAMSVPDDLGDDDDMLEVDLEGFTESQDSDIFGVRGSRIFMPPESLTEAGRRRLREAGLGPDGSELSPPPPMPLNPHGNETHMGPFQNLSDSGDASLEASLEAFARSPLDSLPEPAISSIGSRSGLPGAGSSMGIPSRNPLDPPAASPSQFNNASNQSSRGLKPFPRELTERSVRVLNQAYNTHDINEIIATASPYDLIQATVRALLNRGLITEGELLRELANVHRE